MATTFHDWNEQLTDALRLTRLRQYKTEILAMLGAPDVSADGKSISRQALQSTYETLVEEENRLLTGGAGLSNGGVMLSRRGRY